MILTYDVDSTALSGAISRLAVIGYHELGVCKRLGLEALEDLQMRALAIYRQERLQERDPLTLAIDLFLFQGPITESEFNFLFPTASDRENLEGTGILKRDEKGIVAQASLYPVGRRLIFSDQAWPQLYRTGSFTPPHDQVMFIGTDSRWLARATVRRPAATALDLCCGSGVHALLAAFHVKQVTAVDINPRAARCTEFNAKALGRSNMEVLQGDLYSPVGDRRFDLITANPPFVPAPAQELGFRDGGPTGEDVQRRIVEGLPRHLAKGGIAQIVTELGERDGEPLEERLRQWLHGAPMDIYLQRLRINPAHAYAIGHASGDDYSTFLNSAGRWSANLRAQGYHRVISVLIAFQWSENPWTRVDEAQPPRKDAGEEIEAIYAAEKLVREPDLTERLKRSIIARTGPIALLETRALGAPMPPTTRARRAGLTMPVDHPLDSTEKPLLLALENPTSTVDLLVLGAKSGLEEEPILAALVSLLRKGLIKVQ